MNWVQPAFKPIYKALRYSVTMCSNKLVEPNKYLRVCTKYLQMLCLD